MTDPLAPIGDGHTEVPDDVRERLIPTYIATLAELYEAEAENIAAGTLRRRPDLYELLNDAYLRELHRVMFDEVWRWAGRYRQTDVNIGGVDWHAREMGTTSGPVPEGAGTLAAMEHRLRTEQGAAAYGRRSCTVEPIFGQVKENRGIRRFMRRGLAAAESEWQLVCATSNVLKLFSHAQGRALSVALGAAT
ncbi:MAG: transposase [Acidimicrobiia bacterium]